MPLAAAFMSDRHPGKKVIYERTLSDIGNCIDKKLASHHVIITFWCPAIFCLHLCCTFLWAMLLLSALAELVEY